MALTETRPEADVNDAAPEPGQLDSILATGDHKVIGRLWIAAGSLFLLAALVVSAAAGLEAADLGSFSLIDDALEYIQLWSMGRELILFAGVLPIIVGLATYLVPLQVGASSLAFARGAAGAFWTWLASAIILVISFIDNGGPAGGRLDSVVLWSLAFAGVLFGLCWAMVCIATTILGARCPGMSLDRVPVSAWGFGVFSVVGLFLLPVTMAQLLLAYIDTKYGYLPTQDVRASLLSIDNSFSFAPSIFLIAVPTLGMAVEAIAVATGRPVRFHRSVMASLGLLGIISVGGALLAFGGRGRELTPDNGVLVVALLAAILPAISILGLVGDSIKGGKPTANTPMAAGLLAGLLTVAGIVVAALATIDPILGFIETLFDTSINSSSALVLSGTAFHEGLRGILIAAAVLGVIAGVHTWSHKIWGRNVSDPLGLLSALTAAGGGLLWGVGGVIAGFLEEPLLMITPEVKDGVELMNIVALIGMALVAGAAALLVLNVLSVTVGRGASSEPWSGATLEWSTASPPPVGNFETMPVVISSTPVVDAAEADAEADTEENA